MNKIYFLGDIHGEFYPIRKVIDILELDSTDTIVLLGDAGLNFGKRVREKDQLIKYRMQETGVNFFIIRGNHDDRPSNRFVKYSEDWTNTESYFGKPVYVEKEFPNIRYALDIPMIYEMNDKKVLVMGGAYSVDKEYRLYNKLTWYEDEQMSAEEMNMARTYVELAQAENYKFDLVLTHTCPLKCEPIDLFIPQIDQRTVDKRMEKFFDEIEEKMNYSKWLFGHYHETRIYPTTNNKQQLMLSNDYVVEFDSLMKENVTSYDLVRLTYF